MSRITTKCPYCDCQAKAPADCAGRKARCKACGKAFVVAAERGLPAEAAPAAVSAAPVRASRGRVAAQVAAGVLLALVFIGALGFGVFFALKHRKTPPVQTAATAPEKPASPVAKANKKVKPKESEVASTEQTRAGAAVLGEGAESQKPEPRPEPQAEPKPEPEPNPEPEPQPEPKPEPKPGPEPKAKPEPTPESKPKPTDGSEKEAAAAVLKRVVPSTVAIFVEGRMDGQHTGFVVDSTQQLIVTSNAAVSGSGPMVFLLPFREGAEPYKGRAKIAGDPATYERNLRFKWSHRFKVVARDPARDLALIKPVNLPSTIPMPPTLLLAATAPTEGQRCWAVTFALEADPVWGAAPRMVKATSVKKFPPAKSGRTAIDAPVILTDTPHPGAHCGGPLVNDQGELVGMMASAETTGEKGQGVFIQAAAIRNFLARKDVARFMPSTPPSKHVLLPAITRPSTDKTLPGNWLILDRSKPIPKLIDRAALLPRKPSLVMFERQFSIVKKDSNRFVGLLKLPLDIGNEQFFLGCLPSLIDKQGKHYQLEGRFFQFPDGCHNRYVELAALEDLPITKLDLTLKMVVLLPPTLKTAERIAYTRRFLQMRDGPRKDFKRVPGFLAEEFTQGGPSFVNARPGRTTFESIHNVQVAVESLIKLDYKDRTALVATDPDRIKAARKGACLQVARLLEKSLHGICRGFVVDGLVEIDPDHVQVLKKSGLQVDPAYPAFFHANVALEDPATGKYFIGNNGMTMGPHDGMLVLGIVHKFQPVLFVLPLSQQQLAPVPPRNDEEIGGDHPLYGSLESGTSFTGSSRLGKNSQQMQAWLNRAPADFRTLAKKLAP